MITHFRTNCKTFYNLLWLIINNLLREFNYILIDPLILISDNNNNNNNTDINLNDRIIEPSRLTKFRGLENNKIKSITFLCKK